ncbi:MAG: phage holin family protein [Eggerthellaceae bacterium]|jgi:putative membrane protein
MHFIIRWIITAIAVAAAIAVVPGIQITSPQSSVEAIAVIALFLALINMVIKPILKVLGAPITILTLGLFALVVNTLLFYLAAACAGMFGVEVSIASFWSAFFAAIIISIVTFILDLIPGLK